MLIRLLFLTLLLPLFAQANDNQVVFYDGYGSSERFQVDGRVIEAKGLSQATEGDSWWRNLWRNLRLLKSSDREDVKLTVTVGGYATPATSGVLVTKQINGDGRDPLLNQKRYKTGKIDAIFSALPWVQFVLVGDDGELDPETYCAIWEKYPARVRAIYIRSVTTDRARKVCSLQADLAAAVADRRTAE